MPTGDPYNLAASIQMHNGVLAIEAAFAQRRLATIRTPRLAEAILADGGSIDGPARAAMEYAAAQKSGALAYPGVVTPKRMVMAKGSKLPKRMPAGGGQDNNEVVARVVIGALLGWGLLS